MRFYLIKLFTLLLILTSISLYSQRFTNIQAGLTGVSESASNWIDYNEDGAIDIFVTGDFYKDNGQNISTKLYKNIRNDKFTP